MAQCISRVKSAYAPRRAFTIIELIVVILIIVIISAILLPALGGARNVARKTATQNLIQQLLSAVSRFEQDQRRLPGYFSPTEMGNNDQFAGTGSGRGMSSMENVMLDLAGGVVPRSTAGSSGGGGGSAPPPSVLPENLAERVGPLRSVPERVDVDTSKIGVSTNGFAPYFVPDNKFYQPQFSRGSDRQAQNSAPPHSDVSSAARRQLPDLIDAFGTPILAWVMDDTATQPIAAETDFARMSSGPAPGTGPRARFYWNSNSAFLSANAVGPKFVNMPVESMLGGGVGTPLSDADRISTLNGLLGHPGYPDDRSKTVANIRPTAARGRFIVHSAGVDGVYLGVKDSGAKHAITSGTAKRLAYGLNFKNRSGADLLDGKGTPTTIDVLDDFDDIVVSGGN
ncbi:MAG: prepilin-type N-terminal cleavage/methylation domain-containing protein [Phycisphaeraceae bacterium]|nr:prepilin-type N-terminal cleavage/methylation domain-containing protein [Phycisphaeraceae bacterium]QYK47897.1 MAG: prepilin-type N-terminal cleavage/methylation domain-containing protein [Phycisphaeraceae bacterium]